MKNQNTKRVAAVRSSRIVRPHWWSIRKQFENCNIGFCKHCGWKNPPRKIYKALKRSNDALADRKASNPHSQQPLVTPMKTLDTLTKDECSLLLFMESRAAHQGGRVKIAHMDAADMKIASRWNREGFVKFGRIRNAGLSEFGNHWCFLSDEAWILAHAERKARAARTWAKRQWKTIDEKTL